MDKITIRKIQPSDNTSIAAVIRNVLIEYNVPKVGTAYADPQLDYMYETYQSPKSVYFVAEEDGVIIGGAGIAPLQNGEAEVCELQKMYILSSARGKGFGVSLMEHCLKATKEFGFRKCYLETMPYMEAAQSLYKRSGFEYISAPMGNTGHTSCPIWMLKQL